MTPALDDDHDPPDRQAEKRRARARLDAHLTHRDEHDHISADEDVDARADAEKPPAMAPFTPRQEKP